MKNFLKRPYYYFFTSIFLVIISLLIATIFQNRLSENERSRLGWVDKKFVSVSDSIFVRPYYVIADVFNILKFNFFTRGIDVRNLKIDYQRLKHEFSLLKDENEKLSRIIKYSPTYSKIIATGRILSDPHSFSVSAFSISVGKKDGVEFGDIVTNEHGLVGKIVN